VNRIRGRKRESDHSSNNLPHAGRRRGQNGQPMGRDDFLKVAATGTPEENAIQFGTVKNTWLSKKESSRSPTGPAGATSPVAPTVENPLVDPPTANPTETPQQNPTKSPVVNPPNTTKGGKDNATTADPGNVTAPVPEVVEFTYRNGGGVSPGITALEYLGTGYNLFEGNPRGSKATEIDPGFRQSVIELHQSQAMLTINVMF